MPPLDQSTYLGRPESASIEIPHQTSLHKIFKNCFYEVNLVSQCSDLEVFLQTKFGSERGILIDVSGPLRYVH